MSAPSEPRDATVTAMLEISERDALVVAGAIRPYAQRRRELYKRMRAALDAAKAEETRRSGRTHWEGCWRLPKHHECAVSMLEQQIFRLNIEQASDVKSNGMPVVDLDELGDLLRQQRRIQRLSLRDVEEASGVNASTLCRLERAVGDPSAGVIEAVACWLRVGVMVIP